ncbi:MAG TPA: hypothetical protein H9794_10720 [Candidatus Mediterraneibacter merdigallinarum]|nr:hypothetical protein [Candidatus Mediterraneibacter merdigallinarum]
MSKKRMVFVFVAIVAVLLVIPAAFVISAVMQPEEEQEQSPVAEEQEILSPEETIRQFADVIYTYDTSERQFYDGAEEYMTPEAYETLVPMQDPEEADEAPIQMTSKLDSITCYYKVSESPMLEAVADVEYSLSGMGDFRNHQLLKLVLTYTDGWKISECTVLATIEQ